MEFSSDTATLWCWAEMASSNENVEQEQLLMLTIWLWDLLICITHSPGGNINYSSTIDSSCYHMNEPRSLAPL